MRAPKLRFKDFSGEWKICLIGDITESLKSGLSRKLQFQDIGIPVIRANNIENGELNFEDLKYWYIDDPQGANTNNYLVHKNDILINFINSEAKMGTAAIVLDEPFREMIYTTNILKMKTNKLADSYFFYCYTQTKKYKDYIKVITKPAVNQASFTTLDFKKHQLALPSVEEQIKIASFFKALNTKIKLQQEKINLLKEQKKGYMQKIFNRELRFKDEDGNEYLEWKDYTLSKIGTTFTGLSGKTKNDFGHGNHYFVTYVNVFNNLFAVEDGIEKVNVLENENQSLVQKGDIFITTSSETPHEVGMASIWTHSAKNLHLNSFCFGYRLYKNENILPEFVAISLRSEYMRKKIILLAQGSTRFNLSKNELMKQTIKVPASIEEQIKIVNFYKMLDMKIFLAQKKFEALHLQKQAFMQQMFI